MVLKFHVLQVTRGEHMVHARASCVEAVCPVPPLTALLTLFPFLASTCLLQVMLQVQFPRVVRTADLDVGSGTCLFDEALKVGGENCPWTFYSCNRLS